MRVLTTTLMGVLFLTATTSGDARQASEEATTVKVYHVGDLVARQAVRETTIVNSVPKEEWPREYKQTIESLHNLAKLIETIVPAETGAAAAHDDSLSIVVRHTAAGHQQIAELLKELRTEERPVVELTLIPMMELDGDDPLSGKLENFLDGAAPRPVLDPDQTQDILKTLESRRDTEATQSQSRKVRLLNGRKTQIGSWMLPMYATIVVSDAGQEFRLRVDVVDPGLLDQKEFLTQTQSFALAAGHSAIVVANGYDGEVYWLAIPKRIEPEQKVTSVSRDTAE